MVGDQVTMPPGYSRGRGRDQAERAKRKKAHNPNTPSIVPCAWDLCSTSAHYPKALLSVDEGARGMKTVSTLYDSTSNYYC